MMLVTYSLSLRVKVAGCKLHKRERVSSLPSCVGDTTSLKLSPAIQPQPHRSLARKSKESGTTRELAQLALN